MSFNVTLFVWWYFHETSKIRCDPQLTIDSCIDLDSFFDEPAMLTDMFTTWSDTAFVLVVMSTGKYFDHLAVHIIFSS